MITIDGLQKEIFSWAIEKGWWPLAGETQAEYAHGSHRAMVNLSAVNIPEKFCLMHEEISEALGDYRDGRAANEYYYENEHHAPFTVQEYIILQAEHEGRLNFKPCGIPVELADCIIRILDFAEAHGIDMEHALRLKQDYNKTRAYRHGGKKA
jgi:hypothetical protein